MGYDWPWVLVASGLMCHAKEMNMIAHFREIGLGLVAMVVADACLEKFGGDHVEETLRNYRAYLKTIGPRGGEPVPPAKEETTEA